MSKFYLIFLFALFALSCSDSTSTDDEDLLARIKEIPGVEVLESAKFAHFSRSFIIDFEQPLDHNNPEGIKFKQRLYLHHAGTSKPMIFAPNGYEVDPHSVQELAITMEANCLTVVHRFFENARPEPMDWQYLTIEQSANDHHRIVESFKKIYPETWISSGVSKGGQAVLFHRRFFPSDVDATVAYVAPIVFGINDMRPEEYLEMLGESGCFEKIKTYQRDVLRNREGVKANLENYIAQSGLNWSLNRDLILELAIMDYPFSFWQYHSFDCTEIPDTNVTTLVLSNHLFNVVYINSFSDYRIEYYQPYVYQALTETGAPGYRTDYLEDLLKEVPTGIEDNPNFSLLAPSDADLTYNPVPIYDVNEWLNTEGNQIMYIYGGIDPWTGAAFEYTGQTDVFYDIQNGLDHGVKISDLDNPDAAYKKLGEWLGLEITAKLLPKLPTENELKSFRLD
jgi:hypothetical protein